MQIRNLCRGISVLEVMIAFAATTVFVAVSAPLSRDLGVRLRVIEGMDVAAAAQQALLAHCQAEHQAIVDENSDAGFHFSPGADGFVQRVELRADCARSTLSVRLWTRNTGADTDPVIELLNLSGSAEGWSCQTLSGDLRHVPKICWPDI